MKIINNQVILNEQNVNSLEDNDLFSFRMIISTEKSLFQRELYNVLKISIVNLKLGKAHFKRLIEVATDTKKANVNIYYIIIDYQYTGATYPEIRTAGNELADYFKKMFKTKLDEKAVLNVFMIEKFEFEKDSQSQQNSKKVDNFFKKAFNEILKYSAGHLKTTLKGLAQLVLASTGLGVLNKLF